MGLHYRQRGRHTEKNRDRQTGCVSESEREIKRECACLEQEASTFAFWSGYLGGTRIKSGAGNFRGYISPRPRTGALSPRPWSGLPSQELQVLPTVYWYANTQSCLDLQFPSGNGIQISVSGSGRRSLGDFSVPRALPDPGNKLRFEAPRSPSPAGTCKTSA